MIKTNKNKAVTFRLIKIILVVAIGFVCFYQFKKLNYNQINDISLTDYSYLLPVLLLVVPNYFLEYRKWNLIVQATNEPVSRSTKIQSFFAGIITGMLTPNMQGNFIGRIYYFRRRVHLPITLLTLIANLGQFCVTIILGIFAFFLLDDYNANLWGIPTVILIAALIFYFYFEQIPSLRKRFKWYKHIQRLLESHKLLRFQILWLSLLRNIVFSVQFLFALHAFGAEINLKTYWLIWELYLWTTLSPSLIFGKLFVRESIALWVFAAISLPEWNIVAASFSIWIINLLLPTLLGLFICKKRTK